MHERRPTAQEARFWERLWPAVPGLLEWYHHDADGTPWMCVSLDVTRRASRSVSRTWRLDFDGTTIVAGASPAALNWDGGVRAIVAGVDHRSPDGLRAEVSGPDDAADLAATWFRDRLRSEQP